ncbi:MAG: ABC transporter ATP-binding protein [Mariprofundaceae bacterium]
MGAVMQLSDVSLARGGRTLLSALDCEIRSGQVTVVLGPNGAGKSSLLLAMAGLIPATGHIEVSGRELTEYSRDALPNLIAWQGELPPTEFGLTVQQRLKLAATDGAAGVGDAARAMDIDTLLDRPLGELSSGERQRVELAALMLRDAPLWLLDEPTAHLDLKHQIRCVRMLKSERAAGRAIVTVLHDIQQAMAIADRVVLIDGLGGVAYGEAHMLLNGEKLAQIFDAPLTGSGGMLTPDYRGDT